MISFWAWGATEGECLHSLARLIENLSKALRQASTSLRDQR